MNHIEIVFAHLAPLTWCNFSLRYDKDIHAHFSAKHRSSILVKNGESAGRFSFEILAAHTARIWKEIINQLVTVQSQSVKYKYVPGLILLTNLNAEKHGFEQK